MSKKRKNVKHGTYQVVLRRPAFVVLASDTGATLNGETRAEDQSKSVCHDTLPLALAIGGMGWFSADASGRETNVRGLLLEAFPAWAARGRFSLHMLHDWAKETLLDRVKEVYEPDNPKVTGPQFVTLWAAFCNRGRAESTRLIVGHNGITIAQDSLSEFNAVPSQSLLDRTNKKFSKPGDPCGTTILEPGAVIEHARSIIDDAIKADKLMAGGGIPSCGGQAEVVLVDSTGARFA